MAKARPSALERQHRDALSVPGVHTIVLIDVINDIQQSPHQYAPEAIINGHKEFASQARTRAVRIVATTIPPYKGFLRYEAAGEHCRQAVNTYIRHSGLFDNVLDFDAALKDPPTPGASNLPSTQAITSTPTAQATTHSCSPSTSTDLSAGGTADSPGALCGSVNLTADLTIMGVMSSD